MKIAPLFAVAIGCLLSLAGCANEPPAPKNDGRLGGSAGVTVSSHDMSRVVPTRPTANPPAN